MKKTLIGTALFTILVLAVGISSYNNLHNSEVNVFTAWADLDATLQRRADLIPNLVATTKGYMQYEANTLQNVTEARAKATSIHLDLKQLSDPQQVQRFVAAQQELQSSLARLLAIVERYPELKANQAFLDLQHQLEGTENRINYGRQQVNNATRQFNFAIRKFPDSMINNLFLKLEKKEFYKAEPGAQEVVKVDFS